MLIAFVRDPDPSSSEQASRLDTRRRRLNATSAKKPCKWHKRIVVVVVLISRAKSTLDWEATTTTHLRRRRRRLRLNATRMLSSWHWGGSSLSAAEIRPLL